MIDAPSAPSEKEAGALHLTHSNFNPHLSFNIKKSLTRSFIPEGRRDPSLDRAGEDISPGAAGQGCTSNSSWGLKSLPPGSYMYSTATNPGAEIHLELMHKHRNVQMKGGNEIRSSAPLFALGQSCH